MTLLSKNVRSVTTLALALLLLASTTLGFILPHPNYKNIYKSACPSSSSSILLKTSALTSSRLNVRLYLENVSRSDGKSRKQLTAREALNFQPTKSNEFIFGAGAGAQEGGKNIEETQSLFPKDAVGFSNLSETLNGRLAMLGLSLGLLTEWVTGKSFVEQIGLDLSQPLLPLCGLGAVSIVSIINHNYDKNKKSGVSGL